MFAFIQMKYCLIMFIFWNVIIILLWSVFHTFDFEWFFLLCWILILIWINYLCISFVCFFIYLIIFLFIHLLIVCVCLCACVHVWLGLASVDHVSLLFTCLTKTKDNIKIAHFVTAACPKGKYRLIAAMICFMFVSFLQLFLLSLYDK